MHGSAQPEPNPEVTPTESVAGSLTAVGKAAEMQGKKSNDNGGNNSSERRVPEEGELASTLQLLVERAQYITGATGTALALPHGEEMVCRASAGASAPAVGARLQVKSGLTGESISRRQLLRCDNAEADPRVNLEACRALGIASIVVLPLLRKDGEVRGLFELFSDHPYAFEERDLIALERMAALTMTALDLAEQSQQLPGASTGRDENRDQVASQPIAAEEVKITKQESPEQTEVVDAGKIVASEADAKGSDKAEVTLPTVVADISPSVPAVETIGEPSAEASISAGEQHKSSPTPEFRMPEPLVVEDLPPVLPSRDLDLGDLVVVAEDAKNVVPLSAATPVPPAMLRIQKCATCGFPVSEGRTLCLDCERKTSHDTKTSANGADKSSSVLSLKIATSFSQRIENEVSDKAADPLSNETSPGRENPVTSKENASSHLVAAADSQNSAAASEITASEAADEFVPAFLANSAPYRESWFSKNYVNVLAGIVLILCILVALVVFR
jgi:putative methionine-R-sulfoxide reductase with GAF domain